MNTTIQFRTDVATKRKAQKIAEDIGLDLSSVFNATLKQMIRVKGLPFTPRTENGFTPEQEDEMLRSITKARRGKRYRSAESLHAAILSEK